MKGTNRDVGDNRGTQQHRRGEAYKRLILDFITTFIASHHYDGYDWKTELADA